jgi:hypothetical protein
MYSSDSRRGFNKNHFPDPGFYLQEVVKDAGGEFTMRSLGAILHDHRELYAGKCPMTW